MPKTNRTTASAVTQTKQARPGSKEWNRMWAALKAEFGDTVQAHGYESWQYMGTEDGQHCFRHRDHAIHGRIVWYTAVSA